MLHRASRNGRDLTLLQPLKDISDHRDFVSDGRVGTFG